METRPSAARIKENLFNILENFENNFFANKIILDLFAGSGALGLEALSRGAAKTLFIENNNLAINTIKANIDLLNLQNKADILKIDAKNLKNFSNWITKNNIPKFDVIFADPPYNNNLGQIAFEQLLNYNLVNVKTIFVLEESKQAHIVFSAPLELIKTRIYGNTSLYFCMLEKNYNG